MASFGEQKGNVAFLLLHGGLSHRGFEESLNKDAHLRSQGQGYVCTVSAEQAQDLSSYPESTGRKLDVVACHSNFHTRHGDGDRGLPFPLPTGSLASSVGSRPAERPYTPKTKVTFGRGALTIATENRLRQGKWIERLSSLSSSLLYVIP